MPSFTCSYQKLRKEPSMDAVPYAEVKNVSTWPEVLNVGDKFSYVKRLPVFVSDFFLPGKY